MMSVTVMLPAVDKIDTDRQRERQTRDTVSMIYISYNHIYNYMGLSQNF